MERLRSRDTSVIRRGAAFVAVLAYGYWFTDRRPFTGGASLALLVPVVVLIAIAETRRFRRRSIRADAQTRQAPLRRVAIVVWTTVVTALVAWELLALRSLPRSAHPTISSLVESIEQYHVGRIGLFFVWLWLGWTLAS
jgi:hypothetical protein